MNDRFVEDLKSRVDLVDVVKRYGELKKSGKNFMGRSPFRNERTPSFSVSPDKQMWYDFGNSEGGDVITFLEKAENCSFKEAVEMLADMVGVEIPKGQLENKGPSKEEKKDLFALHEAAAVFFATLLQKDSEALKYLNDRGITEAIAIEWQLGFGGRDAKNAMTLHLLSKGFSEAQIAESGVAFERSFGDKSMQDRFWGRILIPIREPREGKIVAFSGREIMGRDVAKYVNSPENPVYHKSATLFGLDRARKPIREEDRVVLVEGNFDVVMAQHYGIKTCVATCGTSLTEEHLRLLRRSTKNLYLAFDTDIAGKKATLRGVEMCLKMDLTPYMVPLGEFKDFGEMLEQPAESLDLDGLITTAPKALDYLLEAFAVKLLTGSVEGEKKFLDHFFALLKNLSRPIEVDDYLAKIAVRLDRSRQIIDQEFVRFNSQQSNQKKEKYVEEKKISFSREQNFAGFINAYWEMFAPSLLAKKEEFLDFFSDDSVKKLLDKRLSDADLDEAENKQILAWTFWQENLYESEPSPEQLKQDFKLYFEILKIEKLKRDRILEAKRVQAQLS